MNNKLFFQKICTADQGIKALLINVWDSELSVTFTSVGVLDAHNKIHWHDNSTLVFSKVQAISIEPSGLIPNSFAHETKIVDGIGASDQNTVIIVTESVDENTYMATEMHITVVFDNVLLKSYKGCKLL